jgi:uncharacterized protein YutE (UPF0331/DUF86 family)
MVKLEILQKRMKKADQYLGYLKEIRAKNDLEEFKKDPMVFGSTERFLHLTIEALLDIGNHIISDQDLGEVEFYKDIPELLYQNNYLNENQKDVFVKITGFRNILVHDYLEIDYDIVYSILNNNLNDLESILKEYAKLL